MLRKLIALLFICGVLCAMPCHGMEYFRKLLGRSQEVPKHRQISFAQDPEEFKNSLRTAFRNDDINFVEQAIARGCSPQSILDELSYYKKLMENISYGPFKRASSYNKYGHSFRPTHEHNFIDGSLPWPTNITRLLIDYGANPYGSDVPGFLFGYNSLLYYLTLRSNMVLSRLESLAAGLSTVDNQEDIQIINDAFVIAAAQAYDEVATYILDNLGYFLQDKAFHSALVNAALKNHESIFNLLLAKIDLQHPNARAALNKALLGAAAHGHTNIVVRILILDWAHNLNLDLTRVRQELSQHPVMLNRRSDTLLRGRAEILDLINIALRSQEEQALLEATGLPIELVAYILDLRDEPIRSPNHHNLANHLADAAKEFCD